MERYRDIMRRQSIHLREDEVLLGSPVSALSNYSTKFKFFVASRSPALSSNTKLHYAEWSMLFIHVTLGHPSSAPPVRSESEIPEELLIHTQADKPGYAAAAADVLMLQPRYQGCLKSAPCNMPTPPHCHPCPARAMVTLLGGGQPAGELVVVLALVLAVHHHLLVEVLADLQQREVQMQLPATPSSLRKPCVYIWQLQHSKRCIPCLVTVRPWVQQPTKWAIKQGACTADKEQSNKGACTADKEQSNKGACTADKEHFNKGACAAHWEQSNRMRSMSSQHQSPEMIRWVSFLRGAGGLNAGGAACSTHAASQARMMV
eukprot:1143481-Pelagomonas_calceolata.AAC.1